MKNVDPAMRPEDELFDLKEGLHRCWMARRKITVLTVGFATLIFAGIFWTKCNYSSEGFLRAPHRFSEYNAHKAAFWDRETFRSYLEERKLLDDPNGHYLLKALDERFVQAHLKPVQPLSKEDLRYIGDAKATLETVGILGFSIAFADQTAANAQVRVQLLGDYVTDTMLSEDLQDVILTKAGESAAKKQQIDNQIIQKRLALEQAVSRLEAARSIASRYPQASRMEARQLLSTTNDKDASRYLSPMAQLVGTETEIAELKSQLTLLERDAEQNALRSEFYERMKRTSHQVPTGKTLLAEFVGTARGVFQNRDLGDDKTREVYNQIMLVAEQMQTRHLTDVRFVSGPTLPENRSGPGLLALILLSLAGGAMLAGAIVLVLDAVRQPDIGAVEKAPGNAAPSHAA